MTTPTTHLSLLVCVDHRQESVTALRLAAIRARKRGCSVNVLHVIEPPDPHAQPIFGVSDAMREEQVEEAQKMLSRYSAIVEEITGEKPELILKEGNIGETILHTAQEEVEAGMLILGIASGARSRLIGWLSAQLGEKLWMPMLLVPGDMTDQQITDIS